MTTDNPNVHELLAEAVSASQDTLTAPLTIKFAPVTLAALRRICDRHGTNVTQYLRICGEALVEAYPADVEAAREELASTRRDGAA